MFGGRLAPARPRPTRVGNGAEPGVVRTSKKPIAAPVPHRTGRGDLLGVPERGPLATITERRPAAAWPTGCVASHARGQCRSGPAQRPLGESRSRVLEGRRRRGLPQQPAGGRSHGTGCRRPVEGDQLKVDDVRRPRAEQAQDADCGQNASCSGSTRSGSRARRTPRGSASGPRLACRNGPPNLNVFATGTRRAPPTAGHHRTHKNGP